MGVVGIVVLLCLSLCTVYSQDPHKICAYLKDKAACNQLERHDFVRCKEVAHHVDCLLGIEQNVVDFGRVTPEEALIGAKFLKNVVVVGEFRANNVLDNEEFAMVVLVRKTHTGGFKSFRGKKYCHPGFKFNHVVTDFLLKEFENKVLKENAAEGCRNNVSSDSLFEKELKALSDFFGPSCRPGPWIGFEKYDTTFYNNYSSLCQLCDNNCNAGNEPFTDSINCLVHRGDVAVTTNNTVYRYFEKIENKDKIDQFAYLCPDGTVNGLDKPCIWSKQPWNLIVVNKQKESDIKHDLQKWFATVPNIAKADVDVANIQLVLFPEDKDDHTIKIVEESPPLLEYLKEYRAIPAINEKCGENITWCTVSHDEQNKCEWLAQASANLALQPSIKCVQSLSQFACLEDIKLGQVDVAATNAHFGYIARKKGLTPLAFPDTAERDRIKPIIVIRSNTTINSLQDLQGKHACFPEYGGVGWLSFINIARNEKVLSNENCDYGQLISDFVADSCMPGAHDREHEVSGHIDQDKLCKLCEPDPYESKTGSTCNSNIENRFYGNSGALRCLKEKGDFAVVSQKTYEEFNSNDFQVLCRNGSLASTTGFNVDENCALTKIIDSEVLVRRTTSKQGNIGLVLLNLETRFGTDRHKAFEVFNSFNGTLNLLFQDSTQGLSKIDSDSDHIKKTVKLFNDIEKCVESDKGDSAVRLGVTVLPLVICLLLSLF